jgi:hypothetical protein
MLDTLLPRTIGIFHHRKMASAICLKILLYKGFCGLKIISPVNGSNEKIDEEAKNFDMHVKR